MIELSNYRRVGTADSAVGTSPCATAARARTAGGAARTRAAVVVLATLGAAALTPLAAQAAQAAPAVPATYAVQGGVPQAVTRHSSVWDQLAMCESSGDWHINTGNGFYGGLQFWQPTWQRFGGRQYADRADLATPDEQVAVAGEVLEDQGWNAWPACARKLGLTGRSHREHTVKAGETLSEVAGEYGVEGGWSALYRLNKAAVGPDPDTVAVGTVLAIP